MFRRHAPDPEVTRLRAELDALKRRHQRARVAMARTAVAHIRVLENEVAWLRSQFSHERQRAEIAVDQLLSVRVNVGPVTHPTPEEVREMQGPAERLLNDTEFMNAGMA